MSRQKTTCYSAFFIIPSQSRARMELILFFSESGLRSLPSGRAGIENGEAAQNLSET